MRAPTFRSPRHARGFTLLEVALAFALLAIALGLSMRMLSGGLRQVSDARRATEATLVAQSVLDALGTLAPVAPGHDQGQSEDKGYRWELEITPAQDPAPVPATSAAAPPVQGGPTLYRVVLDVSWGKGERDRLRFVTLRARTPVTVAGSP